MRIKYFAAGLALFTIAMAPLPSHAQYYGASGYGGGYGYGGGWKASLIRALAPTLINRGINYLMNRPRQTYQPQQPDYSDSGSRSYSPPHAQRHTTATVSHSVPHSTSHSSHSSSASSHSTHMEVPPPPKMFVPPPPPGVPTGAVLGLYPTDMNDSEPAKSSSKSTKVPH